jgi:hypothetical protein
MMKVQYRSKKRVRPVLLAPLFCYTTANSPVEEPEGSTSLISKHGAKPVSSTSDPHNIFP